MKRGHLLLTFLVLLAVPVAAQADTIYFKKTSGPGIDSVVGTIVSEANGVVQVRTKDGATVSIPKANVFQIIPDAPVTDTKMTDDFQTIDETWSAAGDAEFERPTPTSSPSTHHFGIKGGMNLSNVSADPAELEDGDSLTSYALGGWWGMPLTRSLSLQAEALYSMKGDSETAGGYTASTQLGYIDVPVLARIGFLHGSAAQPSLFLGPSMAFNVSANAKLEGEGTNTEVDVKDQVRAFDFGVVVGGGLDIPVGGRMFGLDLRYSKGLGNAAGDGANGSAYNDVITVMGSVALQ